MMLFTGLQQGIKDGRCMSAAVVPDKQIILAPNRQGTDASLRAIIVDL